MDTRGQTFSKLYYKNLFQAGHQINVLGVIKTLQNYMEQFYSKVILMLINLNLLRFLVLLNKHMASLEKDLFDVFCIQ
jgi:hypothetical protein